jgi:hypothetical protein
MFEDMVDEKKAEPFKESVNALTLLQNKAVGILDSLGRHHFSTCCLEKGVLVTVWHKDEKSKVFVRSGDSEAYLLKKLMEV